MKVQLKKLSQKDIEERKANYDVFVEIKDTRTFSEKVKSFGQSILFWMGRKK